MKFFNQAIKNEEIINDAIEEFEKALALMKQDWLTGYQLGMCYTYYKSVHNAEKAETLFLNAAKYAAVDTLEGTEFKEYFYKTISLQSTNKNVLLDFAAECYLQAAFIRYIQSDFKGAVELANFSAAYSKRNPKSYFFLAKYQSRNKEYEAAIESLKISATLDRDIFKIFISDIDILNNPLFKENYKNLIVGTQKEIEIEKKRQEEIKNKENIRIFEAIYYSCVKRMFFDDVSKYFDIGVGKDDSFTNKIHDLKRQIFNICIDVPLSAYYDVFYIQFEDKYFREAMHSIKSILNIESYTDLRRIEKEIGDMQERIQEKYIKRRKSGDYPMDYLIAKELEEINEVGIGRYYYYIPSSVTIFFDYLKKKEQFSTIKIKGINGRNERICNQYFDYYINRKDPKELPKRDEIKKKWWE